MWSSALVERRVIILCKVLKSFNFIHILRYWIYICGNLFVRNQSWSLTIFFRKKLFYLFCNLFILFYYFAFDIFSCSYTLDIRPVFLISNSAFQHILPQATWCFFTGWQKAVDYLMHKLVNGKFDHFHPASTTIEIQEILTIRWVVWSFGMFAFFKNLIKCETFLI